MKRLTFLTLAVAWLFAIAAPPVARAVGATSTPPAAECTVSDGAAMVPGCPATHTAPVTVTWPDGSQTTEMRSCDYEGVVTVPRPGGGADVFCDYGRCGQVEI